MRAASAASRFTSDVTSASDSSAAPVGGVAPADARDAPFVSADDGREPAVLGRDVVFCGEVPVLPRVSVPDAVGFGLVGLVNGFDSAALAEAAAAAALVSERLLRNAARRRAASRRSSLADGADAGGVSTCVSAAVRAASALGSAGPASVDAAGAVGAVGSRGEEGRGTRSVYSAVAGVAGEQLRIKCIRQKQRE